MPKQQGPLFVMTGEESPSVGWCSSQANLGRCKASTHPGPHGSTRSHRKTMRCGLERVCMIQRFDFYVIDALHESLGDQLAPSNQLCGSQCRRPLERRMHLLSKTRLFWGPSSSKTTQKLLHLCCTFALYVFDFLLDGLEVLLRIEKGTIRMMSDVIGMSTPRTPTNTTTPTQRRCHTPFQFFTSHRYWSSAES